MTDRLVLNWDLDGFCDEQHYYCSETPFATTTKPSVKAIFPSDIRTYTDNTAIESAKTYYVAIGSVRNNVEKLSNVISVSTVIAYRYLRLYITADNGKDQYSEFQEIEIASSLGGPDLTVPLSPAWQSDYLIAGVHRDATKLIDNNFTGINNIWTSDGSPLPHWVAFDLGTPIAVKEIRMWPTYDTSFGDFTNRAPKDFIVQGSNDNATWTDLKTVSNLTGWVRGTPKVILI